MTRRRRLWSALCGALWAVATWLASRRRPAILPEQLERHTYRDQTCGMGLRMTERLRDRLRPSWLRLRRPGESSRDE